MEKRSNPPAKRLHGSPREDGGTLDLSSWDTWALSHRKTWSCPEGARSQGQRAGLDEGGEVQVGDSPQGLVRRGPR